MRDPLDVMLCELVGEEHAWRVSRHETGSSVVWKSATEAPAPILPGMTPRSRSWHQVDNMVWRVRRFAATEWKKYPWES